MEDKQARPHQGEPDRQAVTWLGAHANYSEFQLLWVTLANLTFAQLDALVGRWQTPGNTALPAGKPLASWRTCTATWRR